MTNVILIKLKQYNNAQDSIRNDYSQFRTWFEFTRFFNCHENPLGQTLSHTHTHTHTLYLYSTSRKTSGSGGLNSHTR